MHPCSQNVGLNAECSHDPAQAVLPQSGAPPTCSISPCLRCSSCIALLNRAPCCCCCCPSSTLIAPAVYDDTPAVQGEERQWRGHWKAGVHGQHERSARSTRESEGMQRESHPHGKHEAGIVLVAMHTATTMMLLAALPSLGAACGPYSLLAASIQSIS